MSIKVKVWKQNRTLIVSIPKRVVELTGMKKGQLLQLDLQKENQEFTICLKGSLRKSKK